MNYSSTLIALLVGWASTGAIAAGDAVAGKTRATACVACHQPGSFAGKSEDALATGIRAIVAGKSAHPPVGKLSDEDVVNIAAYYVAAASAATAAD